VRYICLFRKLTRVLPLRRLALASLAVGFFYHPLSAWAQFSPCDLNQDGVVNVTDVTLATNMALGLSSCTASIKGTGGCNVVTVQRVVDASLPGGTCHPTILTWVASTSSNLAGYNVYRSITSGSAYTKLNSSLIAGTTFTDGTCQPGQTYYYAATAVDTSGNESVYSSPPLQALIPTP
jgi:fibronectin type 3 domain-containing protein